MSARPDVPRLSEEELDLLISRSLDGDLSPEEEQQLERLVAVDPAAARRKAELSALVADLKALPEHATPFALATRVSSNVAERGRPGSLGGRIGFFPAPGFAKAALVILGIVGASIAILRPAPKRLAEGPVDVYLYNAATPASPAPQALIAEAKSAPARELAKERLRDTRSEEPKDAEKNQRFAQEADEKRRDAPAEEAGQKKPAAKLEGARTNESAAASSPASVLAEAAPKQKADRDEAGTLDSLRQQAPAKVTNAGALADAAPPPAAPAPAAAPAAGGSLAAAGSRAPRGWTVAVRGEAARRWSLRRAPDDPPPAHGTAVYRVTLDASGRVTALSRVGAGAADPRLDAFVRGMVFEPIAPPAEIQSRAAAKEASVAPADFEIGLEPR